MKFCKVLLWFLLSFSVTYGQQEMFHQNNYTQVVAGYDTDAQALFTAMESDATPVTLTTAQKNSVNTVILGYKSAGIWSKRKAIYGIIGGTASAHKWNWKDPRDLDAAGRLTFIGSPTHSANGIAWNGTSQYADTHLTPASAFSSINSTSIGYYSRTQVIGDQLEIGSFDGNSDMFMGIYFNQTTGTRVALNSATRYNSNTQTNTIGWFLANRTDANTITVYRNGSALESQTATTVSPLSLAPIYLGAGSSFLSTKQCAFAVIGDTLTDTEQAAENTIIANFQSANNR